ncbi:hypothetical protein F5Y18DRAFT_376581 [Xylariaceae sp. FL1019]|nr:hypothetical protein F5Y18DRAFT_376581 [Xylariaceae sp. FL1019]
MAAQRILATHPPTEEDILNSLLENVRNNSGRQPDLHVGLRECALDAEMPLLLNPSAAPLACREPPDEFEAINAYFSAQVHAFFKALHAFEGIANKQSAEEPDLIRAGEGLWATIRVASQSFDIYPDCLHRTFHTRRLTVQNYENLPLLQHVTRLRVFPALNWAAEPGMELSHMRPVSLRVPFELANRLLCLRELDCPWLWERFPIAFSSRALRRFTHSWEGPWRDARAEFGRWLCEGVLLLPPSLVKARFWFWKAGQYGDDMDQSLQMPDLVSSSSQSSSTSERVADPVSTGLRELGTCLEELDIRALLTPELFIVPGDGKISHSALWPRIRHLKVEFHPCSPNGSWYFSGPRGEDPHAQGFRITTDEHYPPVQENSDDEETHDLWSRENDEYDGGEDISADRQPDMFRVLPITEHINPLLLAFAASLRPENMPHVQYAELYTWLAWRPSAKRAREYEGSDDGPPSVDVEVVLFRWGVLYEAPGNGEKGKVTWQVGEKWRPSSQVISAFEDLVDVGGSTEWKAFDYVGEREPDLEVFIP